MNQNLNAILQKLNSQDSNSHSPQRTVSVNQSSSTLSLARTVKLDFPRFLGDDSASWVYKANQYFGYYQTPVVEKLLIASCFVSNGIGGLNLVPRSWGGWCIYWMGFFSVGPTCEVWINCLWIFKRNMCSVARRVPYSNKKQVRVLSWA